VSGASDIPNWLLMGCGMRKWQRFVDVRVRGCLPVLSGSGSKSNKRWRGESETASAAGQKKGSDPFF
jgi:hypothetical protein